MTSAFDFDILIMCFLPPMGPLMVQLTLEYDLYKRDFTEHVG